MWILGFIAITNHGISKLLMDRAWNDTKSFFDSSQENKESVNMTDEYMYVFNLFFIFYFFSKYKHT